VNIFVEQQVAAIKHSVSYSVNYIFGIIQIMNLVYQILELFKSTTYNNPRIQRINLILNSRFLNSFLPMKNFIANHPLLFMFISFFVSLFVFSSILIIIERPISNLQEVRLLDEWSEVFWFVVVSMTTVGYGDRVVQNVISRFIVMLLVIWGNFWSSIFLSAVYPYIELSLREQKAFSHIKRLSFKETIEKASSNLITKIIQLNRLSGQTKEANQEEIQRLNQDCFENFKTVRESKKQLKLLVRETAYFYDDVLFYLEKVMEQTENQVKKGNSILKGLTKTFALYQEKQKKHNLVSDAKVDIFSKLTLILNKKNRVAQKAPTEGLLEIKPSLENIVNLHQSETKSLVQYSENDKNLSYTIVSEEKELIEKASGPITKSFKTIIRETLTQKDE
jgi:hypothetical protein